MNRKEQILSLFQKDSDRFKDKLRNDGIFDYLNDLKELIRLSNLINYRMLVYLFGEHEGGHLAEKYLACNRNLIVFLGQLSVENLIVIAHELKNNEELFFYK